jgi:hypothetical protein
VTATEYLLRALAVTALGFVAFWLIRLALDAIVRSRVWSQRGSPEEFARIADSVPQPGELRPALVCLLVNGGAAAPQAAAATLLDLAARQFVTVDQPGTDPTSTTVALGRGSDREWNARSVSRTPYEVAVLRRVQSAVEAAGPRRATLADLGRPQRDLEAWFGRIEESVVSEAFDRDMIKKSGEYATWLMAVANVGNCLLSQVLAASLLGTFLPEVLRNVVVVMILFVLLAGFIAAFMTLGLFGILGGYGRGTERYRLTATGRRAARYWLGVRRWLATHESLRSLPPAAVEVWGRNLAYASALGLGQSATAATGLAGRRAAVVGTTYGERGFRALRVRYPRTAWPWSMASSARLLTALALAGVLAWTWPRLGGGPSLWAAPREVLTGPTAASHTTWWIGALVVTYVATRSTLDLLLPARVRGMVLSRTRVYRGPRRPPRYLLVVDDGRSGRTRAWVAPQVIGEAGPPRRTVDLRGERWSRRLHRRPTGRMWPGAAASAGLSPQTPRETTRTARARDS